MIKSGKIKWFVGDSHYNTKELIALGANVTCVDQSLKRNKMLEENLLRMKMKTEIIKKDFYKFESKKKFDIVLIDVPCSATGTTSEEVLAEGCAGSS